MTQAIPNLFADMQERALITAQVAAHVEFTQKESFFRLASLKGRRMAALKAHFQGRRVQRLFIGARMRSIDFHLPGMQVEMLPQDFFCAAEAPEQMRRQALIDGAIVLVNNNDVAYQQSAARYAAMAARCTNTAFLAWDWDNHHWMDSSLLLAANSDLYFPAHNENMYLLSRLNWLTSGPVPCGTIQWSRNFLARHVATMLQSERQNAPLGMHVFYPQFGFRNQTVVTLKQHYEGIGFSSAAFHNRTDVDRLNEWCAHKSHWIIPVLNDVPIRIFDAMVTGGIAIVPESLRFLAPVVGIPREHIVFYGPNDILEPQAVVARANALFDAGGADGLVARHRLALELHHGEARIKTMLRCAEETLGFLPLFD
jgi:hypothetical protein